MALSFKGAHFPQEIILLGVRWSVAYPLSYRHGEALLEERGVPINHATLQRWVATYSPLLEEALHRRKRPGWGSGRMDETSIKVQGQWYDLSRAVDKTGQPIDFLCTDQRDEHAAQRFLTKAMRRHGVPETSTIDGSAAKAAAIKGYNAEHGTAVAIRTRKSLNTIVEQDHRGVKRVTRPMVGCKAFDAAQATLVGIERMHRLKKRPMVVEAGDEGRTAAEQFYTLAAYSPHRQGQLPQQDVLRQMCDTPAMPPGAPPRMQRGRRYSVPGHDVSRRSPGLVVRSCADWCPAPVTPLDLEPCWPHPLSPAAPREVAPARQPRALRVSRQPLSVRGGARWTGCCAEAQAWLSLRSGGQRAGSSRSRRARRRRGWPHSGRVAR